MNTTAKITTIGNSVGIVLPKEVLAELNVGKGDSVYISSSPGGVHVTAYDEEFARQMEAVEYVTRKHRDVLRRLAR